MTDTPVPNVTQHVFNDKPITQDLLPGTLSGLLAAAIDDARRLDRDCYRPASFRWHCPVEEGPCEVCLAGSVIARTYRSSRSLAMLPSMFSFPIYRKLYALENMRCGEWLNAYLTLYETPAPLAIEDRLLLLPMPAHSEFDNWPEFDAHLDSLEPVVGELREIELDARKA